MILLILTCVSFVVLMVTSIVLNSRGQESREEPAIQGVTKEMSKRSSADGGLDPVGTVGLFTRCKNEKNIEEFVRYYTGIGVTYFVFYDNYSDIPVSSTLDGFEWLDSDSYDVMTGDYMNDLTPRFLDIINLFRGKTEWCLHVDLDEYLYPGSVNGTIQDVIMRNPQSDMIKFRWVMFGNNGHLDTDGHNPVDTFTRSANEMARMGKSMAKVSHITGMSGPHSFDLRSGSITTFGTNNTVTNDSHMHDDGIPCPGTLDGVYIAHYYTQSIVSHISRRACCRESWLSPQTCQYVRTNFDVICGEMYHDGRIGDYHSIGQVHIDRLNDYWSSHNRNDITNLDILNTKRYHASKT